MGKFIKDQLKGWIVLIVEDEPDSLEVAMRWLKLAGADVYTAENGREALKICNEVKPHLIISDLTMPVMDGWELLYELRQSPDTANLPVIALTAHALSTVRDRALEAGFIAHIPKPLSPTKFIDQIISIIKDVPELAVNLNSH